MIDKSKTYKIPKKLILYFSLVAISIFIMAYFYYLSQSKSIQNETNEQIKGLAESTITNLTTWRNHRMREIKSIFFNPFIQKYLLSTQKTGEEKREFSEWIKNLKVLHPEYRSISVLNIFGKIIFSDYFDRDTITNFQDQELIQDAIKNNKNIISDLHIESQNDSVLLHLILPYTNQYYKEQNSTRVLFIDINPYIDFFNYFKVRQSISETAEICILRQEEKVMTYLNEVQFIKNSALKLKISIDKEGSVEALIAKGIRGSFQGTDYRDEECFVYVNDIPNSPWIIMAKIDEKEIYSSIHYRGIVAIIASLFMIFITFLIFLVLWRHQRSQYYRSLYDKEIAQAALNKHYEYLSKYANDLLILFNQKTEIIEANEQALNVYGYTREEILKLKETDLRTQETSLIIHEQMKKLELDGGLVFETIHKKKNGFEINVEVSARYFEIEGQKFYQNIIRDISERKKAEEALRNSEESYKRIVTTMNEGIWGLNKDQITTYVNPQIEKMLGFENHEILGKPFTDFLFEEDKEDHNKQMALRIGGESSIYERRIKCKDRSVLWVNISATPLFDKANQYIGSFGMFTDITARKESEEKIQEIQSLLFASVEHTPAGILIADAPDVKINVIKLRSIKRQDIFIAKLPF